MSELPRSPRGVGFEPDIAHGLESADKMVVKGSSSGTVKLPTNTSQSEERSKSSEFLMSVDSEMQEYFRDIAMEMQTLFGISKAEAVARINEAFGKDTFEPYPDIMCHEDPEYWAYGLYYGPVPYWENDADQSRWTVREMPPADSPSWTIKE
jgi:hypothetical protein